MCLAMALTRGVIIINVIHSICIPVTHHIIIHIHVCMHRIVIVIVITNVLWCCGDIIRQLLIRRINHTITTMVWLRLRVYVTSHRVVTCCG